MPENSNGQIKEAMPNTEVVAKAKRRRLTAAEKQRLLREAEACQRNCYRRRRSRGCG